MGLQNTFKTSFASDLFSSFDIGSKDQYFVYFGKVDSWTDDSSPDTLVDCVDSEFSAYRNAIALKRIDKSNVFHMVTRYDWVSGTSYAKYDDTVSSLKYYVMTDQYNLYKCIDNGGGRASTAKPEHTEPEIKSAGADGYKWKFLGKVTETARKFLTDEYIPVEYVTNALEDENATQLKSQQFAVDGSLDEIILTPSDGVYKLSTVDSVHTVLDGGYDGSIGVKGSIEGMDNVYMGTTVGFSKVAFNSEQQTLLSNINGYRLHTVDGRGPDIGQTRTVISYQDIGEGTENHGTGHTDPYVIVDKPFYRSLYSSGTDATKFRFLPPVDIIGDGFSAEAKSVMDADYKITNCTVTTRGQDYTTTTVSFPKEPDVGSAPTARSIIAPKGGHGSNPIRELHSSKIMIIIEFNEDESGKIRTSNEFRQFGIIKNPILNDDTNRIAGSEVVLNTDFFVSKPFGITTSYSYVSDNATYQPGNYIIGSETFATAKIEQFRPNVGVTSAGVLQVSNIKGNFKDGDVNSKLVRFKFGTSGGTTWGIVTRIEGWQIDNGGENNTINVGNTTDFIVGETVTQFSAPYEVNDILTGITANEGITGVTAEGIVKFWDSDNKELIVKVTKNQFTDSITAGYILGSTVGYICFNNPRDGKGRFENKGGELIKQFQVPVTAGSDFAGDVSFIPLYAGGGELGSGGFVQNYGRLMSSEIPITESNSNPVYRASTKLILTRDDALDSFSENLYEEDDIVYQGEGSEVVSGKVLEWFTFEGTTGELHLTQVKGGFTHGQGLSGGADFTVTGVSGSQVIHGSGEVLYIENIRPVSRNIEQTEEFKVLIGF